MNKKFSVFPILVLSFLIIASFNIVLAQVTIKLQCNAQIVETIVTGNIQIEKAISLGHFISGPFEGIVNREVSTVILKSGKMIVTATMIVTEAVVSIGDQEAVGEFVIKISGQPLTNVHWRVTSSNLVDLTTGESVELVGHGYSQVTFRGDPYDNIETPFTPDYGIEFTLTGQINLIP